MKKKLLSLFVPNKQVPEQTPDNHSKEKALQIFQKIKSQINDVKFELNQILDKTDPKTLERLFLMTKPDEEVEELFQCCLYLIARQLRGTFVATDKEKNPIVDNWASCRKMLIHPDFILMLKKAGEGNIDRETLDRIEFFRLKDFEIPKVVLTISIFLSGIAECEKIHSNALHEFLISQQ